MKIAISSAVRSLNELVEERFGRCAYFVVADSDTMKFEAFSNPGQGMSGGAGPAASRELANRGAQVLLTGQLGPNAVAALQGAGIRTVTGVCDLTVWEAVKKYLNGDKASQ